MIKTTYDFVIVLGLIIILILGLCMIPASGSRDPEVDGCQYRTVYNNKAVAHDPDCSNSIHLYSGVTR